MTPEVPGHSPDRSIGRVQAGEQAMDTSVEQYVAPIARRGGRYHDRDAIFQHGLIATAYTWRPSAEQWTSDTVMLGYTRRGIRALSQAANGLGPHDPVFLDRIVRTVLLGNCKHPPDKLIEILGKLPQPIDNLESWTISSPVPFYHASGLSKDVYFFSLILLQNDPRPLRACKELVLALKISQRSGSIDDGELEFHRKLTAAQLGKARVVSHHLGHYDLDEFPELDMPGRRLVLEVFEGGRVASYYANGRHHEAMAAAVTSGALALYDLSLSTVVGQASPVQFLRTAQFPCDINQGNFIVRPGHGTVCVDLGSIHDSHSFGDLALRVISYYWRFQTEGPAKVPVLMPLTRFFEAVERHYGVDKAREYIRELYCHVALIVGKPISEIDSLVGSQLTRLVGARLKARYGQSPITGASDYISKNVRTERSIFERRLAETDNAEHGEVHARLYYGSRSLPFLLSDGQLQAILKETRGYLDSDSVSGIDLRPAARERFGRRAYSGMSGAKSFRFSTGLQGSPVARETSFLLEAYYLTPFPDASLVRLGFLTALLSPRKFERDTRAANGSDRWLRTVLSLSGEFMHMFDDPQATAEIADFTQFNMLPPFQRFSRRSTPPGVSRVERLSGCSESWLGLLIMLRDVYQQDGLRALNVVAGNPTAWNYVLHSALAGGLEQIYPAMAHAFPDLRVGREHNYSDQGIATIRAGAKEVARILLGKARNSQVHAIPRLSFPSRNADGSISFNTPGHQG